MGALFFGRTLVFSTPSLLKNTLLAPGSLNSSVLRVLEVIFYVLNNIFSPPVVVFSPFSLEIFKGEDLVSGLRPIYADRRFSEFFWSFAFLPLLPLLEVH